MAAVRFTVPDDVKATFDRTFHDRDKNAIIADLMREAVERASKERKAQAAITRILQRREHAPEISEEEFRIAREAGRE